MKREEERGGARELARVRPEVGARGRPARVRGRPLEGEGGGGQHRGESQTSRCIGWREGGARGCRRRGIGRSYSAGAHCSVLWSVLIACHGMPLAHWSCPPCLGGPARSEQPSCGFGYHGCSVREEGSWEMGKTGLSSKVIWGFHPSIMGLWSWGSYWR